MNLNFINNFIEKVLHTKIREDFNLSKIPQKFKSLGKNKKDRKIDGKTYNEIIGLFFEIYYNEIYFIPGQHYFFLGGMMELKVGRSGVKTIGRAVNNVRKEKYIENPLSLVWTDLWFKNFERGEIKYVKIKGTGTKSKSIEELWKNSNNFEKTNKIVGKRHKIKV